MKKISPENPELIREEFSLLSSHYFNTAYFGPTPKRAKTLANYAMAKEFNPSFYPYSEWIVVHERIRKKIATLLNCPPDLIALTTSTSDAISMLANFYPLEKEDQVLIFDGEYPSDVLPWLVSAKNRGFECCLKKCFIPTVDWLKKNLPPRCKIVNLSHVAFDTGRKIDLVSIGKFLKEKNILFVVDGTQALGGINLTAEELAAVDMYVSSTYKWMLGPYGSAFIYLTENLLKKIPPHQGNWISTPSAKDVNNLTNYSLDIPVHARRLDRGQTPNMLSMSVLEGSLDFFLEYGLVKIQKFNLELRDFFLANFPITKYELITPKDAMGTIVSIHGNNIDTFELAKKLKENNIDVSVRQGNVRISFHIFNTQEQVELLLKVLS